MEIEIKINPQRAKLFILNGKAVKVRYMGADGNEYISDFKKENGNATRKDLANNINYVVAVYCAFNRFLPNVFTWFNVGE
jgi:hypothetical protein